jgi:hypothetical protein
MGGEVGYREEEGRSTRPHSNAWCCIGQLHILASTITEPTVHLPYTPHNHVATLLFVAVMTNNNDSRRVFVALMVLLRCGVVPYFLTEAVEMKAMLAAGNKTEMR